MNSLPNPVYLIGLRGSGKSTIARMLAERFALAHQDLDELVLDVLGVPSVRRVWAELGEPAFRDAEVRVLRVALDDRTPRVIALGGGTPEAVAHDGTRARDLLRAARASGACTLLYLFAQPEELHERLSGSGDDRPPLTDAPDLLEETRTIFTRRDPLYRQLADGVVAVGGLAPEQVATLCERWIRGPGV